jgi:hypothetical protein
MRRVVSADEHVMEYAMAQSLRAARRCGGVAMILVMISVAVSMISVLAFVSASSTGVAVSSNIANHAQARLIAESALQTTLSYITTTTDDWRTLKPNGVWSSAASLLSGTATIRVEDGIFNTVTSVLDLGDGLLTGEKTDPVTVTVTGRYRGAAHTVRSVVVPSIEAPSVAASRGLSVNGSIKLSSNAYIDSYDSSRGKYGKTRSYSARVETNATGSKQVEMSNNSKIYGSVYVGPGANPSSVISTNNAASITGTREASTAIVDLPVATAPNLGSSAGSLNFWQKTSTLAVSLRVSSFNMSGNAILNISGNVTLVVDGDFNLSNNARINLNPGASLTVYVRGSTTLSNNTRINMGTQKAGLAKIYALGSNDVNLSNTVRAAVQIEAPNAQLKISNDARLFGTFLGKSMEISNNGKFHQDLAAPGPALPTVGGVLANLNQLAGTVVYTTQWVENP